MQYKVVPFYQAKNPAEELSKILSNESNIGYRYIAHQYTDKIHPGTAGCFGIGAKPASTVHVGFVILAKD